MEAFKQLSMLTKATLAMMCISMLFITLSFLPWTHSLGALGLFLTGGLGVTAMLNDPEAEERIPLGLRIAVGFGTVLPFALITWLFQHYFFLVNVNLTNYR